MSIDIDIPNNITRKAVTSSEYQVALFTGNNTICNSVATFKIKPTTGNENIYLNERGKFVSLPLADGNSPGLMTKDTYSYLYSLSGNIVSRLPTATAVQNGAVKIGYSNPAD